MDSPIDKPDYSGMTLNERLFAAGLMKRFDRAAKDRDGEEMVRILMQVSLSETDARWSTKTILGNPEKYGY
jgi:hypothetical protein